MDEETYAAWTAGWLTSRQAAAACAVSVGPRELLDAVATGQRLCDQAFAFKCRAIAALYDGTPEKGQLGTPDEVALACGLGAAAGQRLLSLALWAVRTPGLLALVETGVLSERHLVQGQRELAAVELDDAARTAVTLLAMEHLVGQVPPTPAVFAKTLTRCLLQLDPNAALRRQEKGDADRHVATYAEPDGQAALLVKGPAVRIRAAYASLDAALAAQPVDPTDGRTKQQRRFDLLIALLCGTAEPVPGEVQLLVPLSTAQGGDLELAELPGYGPVLPATARQLAAHARVLTRLGVDSQTGEVIALPTETTQLGSVHTPESLAEHLTRPADHRDRHGRPRSADRTAPEPADLTVPSEQARGDGAGEPPEASERPVPPPPSEPERAEQVERAEQAGDRDGAQADSALARLAAAADDLAHRPATRIDPVSNSYRPSPTLRRLVQRRDGTCTWPGCTIRAQACDLDHQTAWPAGATRLNNLHPLCRHHHQVKQLGWTPTRHPDGSITWRNTRTGHVWTRPPPYG